MGILYSMCDCVQLGVRACVRVGGWVGGWVGDCFVNAWVDKWKCVRCAWYEWTCFWVYMCILMLEIAHVQMAVWFHQYFCACNLPLWGGFGWVYLSMQRFVYVRTFLGGDWNHLIRRRPVLVKFFGLVFILRLRTVIFLKCTTQVKNKIQIIVHQHMHMHMDTATHLQTPPPYFGHTPAPW